MFANVGIPECITFLFFLGVLLGLIDLVGKRNAPPRKKEKK